MASKMKEEERKTNPEKAKERDRAYHKKYYQKNKERLLGRAAEWRRNNPEKVKASNKKSYEKHKEKRKIKAKEWRDKNPEKWREYNRQWKKRNPEKYAENVKSYGIIKRKAEELKKKKELCEKLERLQAPAEGDMESLFTNLNFVGGWLKMEKEKKNQKNKERYQKNIKRYRERNNGYKKRAKEETKKAGEIIEVDDIKTKGCRFKIAKTQEFNTLPVYLKVDGKWNINPKGKVYKHVEAYISEDNNEEIVRAVIRELFELGDGVYGKI